MENTFAIRPLTKPAFHIIAPEQSHPRLSLRRVLYVKFLRWVEHASVSSLIKATLSFLTFLALLLLAAAPGFALGMFTAALHWRMSMRMIMLCASLLVVLNMKRFYRAVKRAYVSRERKGNQHTYRGIPLDDFVTYLFDKQAFTTAAMSDLGLSQRKWAKMADELENGDILRRGENNSRIINDRMTREIAVKQIREGFPMVQDLRTGEWVEKRGKFDAWVLNRERQEAKRKEESDKLERKNERLRASIAKLREEENAYNSLMASA